MRVFGNQKWPTLKFGRFENSDIVGTPSYLKHADNSKENLSFLTRGYARAYHELLQGQRYANESLAHS